MYDYCKAQQLDIDALTHEMGPLQMEINFIHGDPWQLADHVYLFKRTMRETGFRHKVYATFMAKPMANLPGSALHLHQSLFDLRSKRNLFADEEGETHSPVSFLYCWTADLSTGNNADDWSTSEFLPANHPKYGCTHQRARGFGQSYSGAESSFCRLSCHAR